MFYGQLYCSSVNLEISISSDLDELDGFRKTRKKVRNVFYDFVPFPSPHPPPPFLNQCEAGYLPHEGINPRANLT